MLKPAILYKDEIQEKFKNYFYTEDMFLETGSLENWIPEISDKSDEGRFQWAIVDHDNKLIGYFDYHINFYSRCMSRFGLISFDRGNILIGKAVFDEIERCINKYHIHRVEWRMIRGNSAERGYDSFLKRYNGTKHILKDALRDKEGNYRDDVIYEIII